MVGSYSSDVATKDYQSMNTKTFVYVKRHNLKNSAKQRGLEFGLSTSDIQKLLSNPVCYFCSTFCSLEITGGISQSNSFTFERLDPVVGYVKGNVVVSCHRCNNKKSVQDQEIVVNRNNPNDCRFLNFKKVREFLRHK